MFRVSFFGFFMFLDQGLSIFYEIHRQSDAFLEAFHFGRINIGRSSISCLMALLVFELILKLLV